MSRVNEVKKIAYRADIDSFKDGIDKEKNGPLAILVRGRLEELPCLRSQYASPRMNQVASISCRGCSNQTSLYGT